MIRHLLPLLLLTTSLLSAQITPQDLAADEDAPPDKAQKEQVVVPQSAFDRDDGVEGSVAAMVVQPDGKIVIGGSFTAVNGVPRYNIARLNADGTLDPNFANSPEAGVTGPVQALALTSDGSIVVGGAFNQAGGVPILNLALYKADGTVDADFLKVLQPGVGGAVLAVAVESDGSILIGGTFATVSGKPRRGIARLTADGSVTGPVPPKGEMTGKVEALAPLPAGGAVAGGNFELTTQNARSLLMVD